MKKIDIDGIQNALETMDEAVCHLDLLKAYANKVSQSMQNDQVINYDGDNFSSGIQNIAKGALDKAGDIRNEINGVLSQANKIYHEQLIEEERLRKLAEQNQVKPGDRARG